MITKGYVTSVDGKTATVRIHRETACESCHYKDLNSACHAELMLSDAPRTLVTTADNEADAKVGDLVEVVTDESKALMLSFVTFVLPLLIAAAAYAVFYFAAGKTPAIIAAFAAFGVSFICFLLLANRYTKRRVRIRISKIIEESKAD